MEFTNEFSVHAPLQTVWQFMLDANEVTPCVPGAQISEVIDDTHYKGTVKVKLGAVQITYRGELELEPDETTHIIVLHAKGTELRGSGGASGTLTSRLMETDGVTSVSIHSKIDVTGKVAQFGRGIMQDVATRLIREFANCLEQKLQEEGRRASDVPMTAPAQVSALSSSSPSPTAPELMPSSTAPAVQPQVMSERQAATNSSELKLSSLFVEVVRSRVARGLRVLAAKIEPS